MKRLTLAAFAAAGASLGIGQAAPLTFDGIEFEDGAAAFADELVSFTPGDPAATRPLTQNGNNALGTPDTGTVGGDATFTTLGRGGELVIKFTDNALIASGDNTDDLYIFEIGADVEDTFVWISTDGMDFVSVGKVTGGTRGIDIDGFLTDANIPLTTKFTYVKVMDDPNEGQRSGRYVGADIDAIGAISSTEAPEIPVPAAAFLFAPLALAALRRRKRA